MLIRFFFFKVLVLTRAMRMSRICIKKRKERISGGAHGSSQITEMEKNNVCLGGVAGEDRSKRQGK